MVDRASDWSIANLGKGNQFHTPTPDIQHFFLGTKLVTRYRQSTQTEFSADWESQIKNDAFAQYKRT